MRDRRAISLSCAPGRCVYSQAPRRADRTVGPAPARRFGRRRPGIPVGGPTGSPSRGHASCQSPPSLDEHGLKATACGCLEACGRQVEDGHAPWKAIHFDQCCHSANRKNGHARRAIRPWPPARSFVSVHPASRTSARWPISFAWWPPTLDETKGGRDGAIEFHPGPRRGSRRHRRSWVLRSLSPVGTKQFPSPGSGMDIASEAITHSEETTPTGMIRTLTESSSSRETCMGRCCTKPGRSSTSSRTRS